MPKRNNTKRYETPDLQPPDGFVVIKAITVADAKRLQTMSKNGDADEAGKQLFSEMVLDWNWGDENGEPLPKPYGNPAVFDLLTPAEIKRLADALAGFPDEKKA